MQIFGVPKSVGQIYGVLYASPVPLSFSDLVERLEISKGSASQGLQLLRSLKAVRRVEKTDSRKSSASPPQAPADPSRRDYYEPEFSLRKLVSGVLRERVAPLASTSAERLTRLREMAERGGREKPFYLDRVKQLETWRRRLNTVLPLLGVLLGSESQK